jgi:hypothetical protein
MGRYLLILPVQHLEETTALMATVSNVEMVNVGHSGNKLLAWPIGRHILKQVSLILLPFGLAHWLLSKPRITDLFYKMNIKM